MALEDSLAGTSKASNSGKVQGWLKETEMLISDEEYRLARMEEKLAELQEEIKHSRSFIEGSRKIVKVYEMTHLEYEE